MIVVCGEALIDLVSEGPARWRALPGGSPANTAVGLARLGTPTALLARLADDVFGRQLREHLVGNGVDLRYAARAEEPTTLAFVEQTPHGAEYAFYVSGTADWQWRDHELPAQMGDDVLALHTGSLALLMAPGAALIEELLRREHRNRVISVDPNVRPSMLPDRPNYRQRVERWIGTADIVKVSADDLAWLYPDEALEAVATRWAAAGPALVVVTRGADGAYARTAGGADVDVPGEKVDVVDTVGAGDSFSAGLLHHLAESSLLTRPGLAALTSEDMAGAVRFAVRVAAVTCTRAGADPPTRADLA